MLCLMVNKNNPRVCKETTPRRKPTKMVITKTSDHVWDLSLSGIKGIYDMNFGLGNFLIITSKNGNPVNNAGTLGCTLTTQKQELQFRGAGSVACPIQIGSLTRRKLGGFAAVPLVDHRHRSK